MSLSVEQCLTWVLLYGYPVLFGVVLAGSLGVPVPTDLLVLAAGGFAAQGELGLVAVLVLVFAAAALGDCIVYGLARLVGDVTMARYGHHIGLGPERLSKARARFGQWQGWSIFMTRWFVTPLALPASVLAGVGRYPLARFLVLDFAGEAVWTGAYGGLGYYFGASSTGLLAWVQDSRGLVAGLAVAVLAAVLLVLAVRKQLEADRPRAPVR